MSCPTCDVTWWSTEARMTSQGLSSHAALGSLCSARRKKGSCEMVAEKSDQILQPGGVPGHLVFSWWWISLISFKMRKHIVRLRSLHKLGPESLFEMSTWSDYLISWLFWGGKIMMEKSPWALASGHRLQYWLGPWDSFTVFSTKWGMLRLPFYWCLEEKTRNWPSAWCVGTH